MIEVYENRGGPGVIAYSQSTSLAAVGVDEYDAVLQLAEMLEGWAENGDLLVGAKFRCLGRKYVVLPKSPLLELTSVRAKEVDKKGRPEALFPRNREVYVHPDDVERVPLASLDFGDFFVHNGALWKVGMVNDERVSVLVEGWLPAWAAVPNRESMVTPVSGLKISARVGAPREDG